MWYLVGRLLDIRRAKVALVRGGLRTLAYAGRGLSALTTMSTIESPEVSTSGYDFIIFRISRRAQQPCQLNYSSYTAEINV
jgi:hypothetical protein